MNQVYKVIWNAGRHAWMAVGELSPSRSKSTSAESQPTATALLPKKRLTVTVSALALAFSAGPAWAAITATGDVNTTPPAGSNSWTIGGGLVVGLSGNGSLTISNGSAVSNSFGTIGRNSGSNGSVTVDGAGSSWTNSSDFSVGQAGTGSLTISNGGVVNVDSGTAVIRAGGSATATLNIGAAAGSTAVAAGTLNTSTVTFAFGTGSSSLVFNHTESAYNFTPTITGYGAVRLLNGTTRFTGNSGDLGSYTGTMSVEGGTLSVADGDTLTLGGNYSQTANGILKTRVFSNTSFGRLSVAGTGSFADNARIHVDIENINALANDETLFSIISAGTLNATTFSVTDNSALFDFAAYANGTQVDLKVSAASSSGVTNSVTANNFTPGLGAAGVLDGFISGGTSHTDMDNVVTALGKLETDQQVSDAVAETLPLLVGGTTQLASGMLRNTNRVISDRQSSVSGLSSGDGFITDRHAWVKPVGSWTRQQARSGVPGYDADSYGLVAGIDGEVDEHTRLGVALSYMNSDVSGLGRASGNSADIDAYQAIAYGSRRLPNHADIELNWQADLGINKNSGQRNMDFIGRTASAVYDSYTAHVGVGAGKRFSLDDATSVTPSLQVDYAYIKDESYTETGADALNLAVGSNHTDELIVMAQGDISHQLNDTTRLTANAGLGYDLLNESSSITASYSGGGAAFTTQGLDPSPWLARAGVGMSIATSDTTDITARYDVEGRDDFLNQTASVNVRWRF